MKKLFSILITICIILTASLPFSAYADETDDPEFVAVSELRKDNYTYKKIFVNYNTSRQLLVSVLPENATNKELKWSSSDPEIVSVDENGKLTGHADGKVTITAKTKDGSKKKLKYTVYGIHRALGNTFSTDDMTIVSTDNAKYTYEQLELDLAALAEAYPDIMSYKSLGKTYDKRKIYEITLGNEKASRHVFIQAAMHAREYLNCLLTMREVEAVCANYYTGAYRNKTYCEIFENTCVHIVPMLNPDGVAISQFGSSAIRDEKLRKKIEKMCKKFGNGKNSYYTNWKANARGTDLNKNYPVNWEGNKTGLGKPRSEGYKGKSAASEKETVILMNRIKELKPKAVISYHSTGSYMYWNFLQKGKHQAKCKTLFDSVYTITGYKDAEPGITGSYKDLGPNFGSWVCANQKIPTLTIETGVKICPLKIDELDAIWEKNKHLIPNVAYWTITHTDAKLKSVKPKSTGFKVKWEERTYQTTGYVVEYSRSSNFSNPTSFFVEDCKQTSATVKKLKANKKYYVHVRTYRDMDGVKFYGPWSNTAVVKTNA